MKRYSFLIMLTMCFFLNSTAQKNDQKPNTPKEDIKVNREYDENGNLIRFDSVYSYNWSSDTTLLKSFSPEDLSKQFGDPFGFISDSTFHGNSFFDEFDQMFALPYSGKQDSLMMKKFGLNQHYFNNFGLKNDSLALNFKDFDDFFNNFGSPKSDSILSKSPHLSKLKSMDEMIKILQQQMQEMEKQHQKFFNGELEWQ